MSHKATVYSYSSLPSFVGAKVPRRSAEEVDPCARGHRCMTAGSAVVPQARSSTPDAAGHSADHDDNTSTCFS